VKAWMIAAALLAASTPGNAAGAESCDDGNTTAGDGCSGSCGRETCGDGIVTPGIGETCEPNSDATCPGACQSNCVCAGAFTATEDLQPCAATVMDGWTFPVDAGDDVYVRADTTRTDTAADLLFFVSCSGEPLLDADDEVGCTFAPPQFACPEGRFTTTAGGTCRVDVGVFVDPDLGSTCTDDGRVDYGLVVQIDRVPVTLDLVDDDGRPASPSGAFVD
jgi:cysteine-rich repeat protein